MFGLNLEGEAVEMAPWIDLTKERQESPEWTIRSREYYIVTPINKERQIKQVGPQCSRALGCDRETTSRNL